MTILKKYENKQLKLRIMKIKPAQYKVGQKVTTYQTNGAKCLIVECVIRWHDTRLYDGSTELRTGYNYAYRVELPNGELSNWTAERSINE